MDEKTYMLVIRAHMKNCYLLTDEKITAILPGFLTTLNNHMDNLEEKLAQGHLAELGVAGHTIKGALLNLGLFELADTARIIEQGGKLLDTDTDYFSLVEYLKQQISLITTH